MGACGEVKEKDKPKELLKKQEPIVNIQLSKSNAQEENDKLKSTPNIPKNYNIKFLDSLKRNEHNDVLEGNLTLGQILTNMKSKENADFEIEFENKATIGSDRINQKLDVILKELFNNEIPETINMKYIYKGLDISENVIQAYQENNKIVGSAILDNSETFGIITYESDNNLITPYYYQRNDYPEFIYVNSFTAYCNAKGCLYLSGGEKEQNYEQEIDTEKYNNFIYINLSELNQRERNLIINKLPNLEEARTWHSMIFVPDKYIFIVGGANNKSVELYDIDKNEISKDSELNEMRCECTLCLINNRYLYAFCGFILHEEYSNTIEKCDLFKQQRKWELVNPLIKNGLEFKPSFFAISYFQENELLLIGGNDNGEGKRFDYLYILSNEENDKDEIVEYELDTKENINIFKDKFFMPINNNKAVNIPLIIGGDIKIIILDIQNGDVSYLNYEN